MTISEFKQLLDGYGDDCKILFTISNGNVANSITEKHIKRCVSWSTPNPHPDDTGVLSMQIDLTQEVKALIKGMAEDLGSEF